MTNLRKFALTYDQKKSDWALKEEGSERARQRFATKAEATRGGVLEAALGKTGGSVRIHGKDGKIREERTYPRNRDPSRLRG